MDSIIEKTRKTLTGFVQPDHKILLAVSGGIDSSVLLNVMFQLSEDLCFKIAVAHFNHQARGGESDADEDFVFRQASLLGLEFVTGRGDVYSEARKAKGSFQEIARTLRGEFLRRSLLKTNSNFIALGHNADDQAETVLINLLRGSGLKGLGGMSEYSTPFIRPMLNCERAEIAQYADDNQIAYREDSSNKKSDYLRNRIRLQLLPILEDYNPQIKNTLTQTAKILRDEEQILSLLDQERLGKVILHEESGQKLFLDLKPFWEHSNEAQQRLSWCLLRKIYGGASRFSFSHVTLIKKMMQKTTPAGPALLPEGWYFENTGETGQFSKGTALRVNREAGGSREHRELLPISVPGSTSWKAAGIQVTARLASVGEFPEMNGEDQAFLDFKLTGENIMGRFPEPGDRFIPLGMSGNKKLKNFFIDEKVGRERRRKIPILTNANGDIIWVLGLRISNLYRITDRTEHVLHLTQSRLGKNSLI